MHPPFGADAQPAPHQRASARGRERRGGIFARCAHRARRGCGRGGTDASACSIGGGASDRRVVPP